MQQRPEITCSYETGPAQTQPNYWGEGACHLLIPVWNYGRCRMMTLHLCVICGGFKGVLGRTASAFHLWVFYIQLYEPC